MTDQDVRDFLEHMSVEEPLPFLDPEPLARRARRRAGRTAVVGAVGIAATIALLFSGVAELQSTPRIPADRPVEPSASPSASPSPSIPTGSRFTSAIHGIAIDAPAGWQTRPATEPWTGEPLDFDSPAADVIFDPDLGDRLYVAIASQPYGGLSEDAWSDRAIEWLCTGKGMAFGTWTVDGANADVMTCGSTASVALVFTDTRGYLIRLVVSSANDEPNLAGAYDWDWHRKVLETVDLRPQEALDAASPSASE